MQNAKLSQAVNLGKDFAGVVTFADLADAMAEGRHKVLSVYRREWTIEPDANYEVVLKAIH